MKRIFLLSSLLLVALFLAACGGGSNELINTTWQWTSMTESMPASQSVVPNPENYTIEFKRYGTFNAKVDCNQVSGSYELDGDRLTLRLGPSTMAECGPDSLYNLYLSNLAVVDGYEIDNNVLILKFGAGLGEMHFEKSN
jgi:heat shock protein HslJ